MASSKHWFESVAEAQRRAKRRLPRSVYSALIAGAERGDSLADNEQAFRDLKLIPRIATGLGPERELATNVMGQQLAMPVLISPTGVQAVHPNAEIALARAAAAAGITMGLSSFASSALPDVVDANPSTLFQLYWLGGRERMEAIVEHARISGARGLIVTLDWVFAHRRDWGSPEIPVKLDWRTMLRMAPEVVPRPRWLASWWRSDGLPTLTLPNISRVGAAGPPGFFEAYGEWMMTPLPSWKDIAWVRDLWDGPFLIKGIAHPDDARRAVDIGATAISVSNHGGNNLDGTPASLRLLPDVVNAVGERVEILLDGGVRRGSDVVKALALGADAVMTGRAALWGLAAAGEGGVSNVLEILRAGIDETLVGLGRRSVRDLERSDVVIPTDFVLRPAATTLH